MNEGSEPVDAGNAGESSPVGEDAASGDSLAQSQADEPAAPEASATAEEAPVKSEAAGAEASDASGASAADGADASATSASTAASVASASGTGTAKAASATASATKAATSTKVAATKIASATAASTKAATKATSAKATTAKTAVTKTTTKAAATKSSAAKATSAKAIKTASAKATAKAKTSSKPVKTAAVKANTGKGDLVAGIYFIVSAMSASQVIDVEGASKADGGNAIVWHVNGAANEKWKITIGKDGYATITSVLSGKVLDIEGASKKKGANVLQWKANGGKNQKWIIQKKGKFYVVKSALGGNLVLDLTGGTSKDGTNVEVWSSNGGKNQLFRFISAKPKGTKAGKRVVKDGVYQMRPTVAKSRSVDIEGASQAKGANALIYTANGEANQAFYLKYDGKGFYTVTSVKSGKQLAPAAACSVPGINVGQYALGSADLAKWKVVKGKKGYQLVNKVTGTALQVEGGKKANCTNVQTWTANSAAAEQFTLKRQPIASAGPAVIELLAGNMVLDVYNKSLDAGAGVGTYRDQGTLNQRFLLSKYGKGYTIRPFNSRLYLTATAKGALVQDKAHKKMARQVWKIDNSGGAAVLVNATTGQAITVNGTLVKANSNVKTAKETGKKAQRFYLRSVPAVQDGVYYLTASSNVNMVLSVDGGRRTNDANVQLAAKSDANYQKFLITSEGKGLYRITNVASGRVVDVSGASKKSGANVAMYSYLGADNQRWKITMQSDFSLKITAAHSGKALNVKGGTAKAGANVNVATYSKSAKGEKFWLQDAAKSNEKVQIGVPCYIQNPQLPTGCESVALTNALRYWGFNLGKTTMADSWIPYGSDGVYNFIGNPRDESGWIICAPGITNTANRYLKSKGSSIKARNITGTSLSGLRSYLDKGCPVVVWTTISMGQPGAATYKHGYPLRNNNHAVVLTGYNPSTGNYQVADSLDGTVWRGGSSFERIYNLMGKQAVVLED